MSALMDFLSSIPAREVRLTAGDALFHRGASVRDLFVVQSGLIHLVRYQENGAPTVMQRAGASSIVAEASLFASSYHCDALAVSDAVVQRLALAGLRRRMAEDPAFASACAEHLAHEVQRMRVRAEILAMKSVGARLAAWLAFNPLPPKGQWSAVAEDIGVSREALYRELAVRRGSILRAASA